MMADARRPKLFQPLSFTLASQAMEDATPIATRPPRQLPMDASADQARLHQVDPQQQVDPSIEFMKMAATHNRPLSLEQLVVLLENGIITREQFAALAPSQAPASMNGPSTRPPDAAVLSTSASSSASSQAHRRHMQQLTTPTTSSEDTGQPVTEAMLAQHIRVVDEIKKLGKRLEQIQRYLENESQGSRSTTLRSELSTTQTEQNYLVSLSQIFVHAHGGRDRVASLVEQYKASQQPLEKRKDSEKRPSTDQATRRASARVKTLPRATSKHIHTALEGSDRSQSVSNRSTVELSQYKEPNRSRFASRHGLLQQMPLSSSSRSSSESHTKTSSHGSSPAPAGAVRPRASNNGSRRHPESKTRKPLSRRLTSSSVGSAHSSTPDIPSFASLTTAQTPSVDELCQPNANYFGIDSSSLLPGQSGFATLSPDPTYATLGDPTVHGPEDVTDWSSWSTVTGSARSIASSASSTSSTTNESSPAAFTAFSDVPMSAAPSYQATPTEAREAAILSQQLAHELAFDSALAQNQVDYHSMYSDAPVVTMGHVNHTGASDSMTAWLPHQHQQQYYSHDHSMPKLDTTFSSSLVGMAASPTTHGRDADTPMDSSIMSFATPTVTHPHSHVFGTFAWSARDPSDKPTFDWDQVM